MGVISWQCGRNKWSGFRLPLWVISGLLFGEAIEHCAQPVVGVIFLAFCVAAYLYSRNLGERILGPGAAAGALEPTEIFPGNEQQAGEHHPRHPEAEPKG